MLGIHIRWFLAAAFIPTATSAANNAPFDTLDMISRPAVNVRLLLTACIFGGLSLVFSVVAAQQQPLGESRNGGLDSRPNIVFVLSDDQDLHMDSLSYMPQLQHHLIEQGTYFRRHYCTVALCCPSRATLWTGKEAHNTNVTDVNPPYGA